MPTDWPPPRLRLSHRFPRLFLVFSFLFLFLLSTSILLSPTLIAHSSTVPWQSFHPFSSSIYPPTIFPFIVDRFLSFFLLLLLLFCHLLSSSSSCSSSSSLLYS